MQKVVDFLEKYVEYIAIALGGLFVLFMVYSYVLQSPVSKKIGTRVETPGTIDEAVDQESAEPLRKKIDSATIPDSQFRVLNFSSAVSKGLLMEDTVPGTLAANIDSQPYELPSENINDQNLPIVDSLPVLPPARAIAAERGYSAVMKQTDPATPAEKVNITWDTQIFTVSTSQLAAEWTRCFGPDKAGGTWKFNPANTEFLSATLYREEKPVGGNWSKPIEIARLWNNQLWPYPAPADHNYEVNYQGYAGPKAPDILTPAFPPLAPSPFGTQWKPVDQVLEALIHPVIAPVIPTIETPHAKPPARPAVREYDRNTVREGRGDRAVRPTAPPAVAPGGGNPDPNLNTPKLPPEPIDPKVVSVPGISLTVLPVVVTNQFNPGGTVDPNNPAVTTPDILIALHDITIHAGITYRYSLQYKLLNPLFNKLPQRVKNPAMVAQFDLVSPMSSPGPEVTPEGQTFFYCAQSQLNQNDSTQSFSFDIFTSADGVLQRQVFKARPGDEIGSSTAQGANFATGYTYVDARNHDGRLEVTLMDSAGNLETRDASRDSISPDHKLKSQQVEQNRSAAATP